MNVSSCQQKEESISLSLIQKLTLANREAAEYQFMSTKRREHFFVFNTEVDTWKNLGMNVSILSTKRREHFFVFNTEVDTCETISS